MNKDCAVGFLLGVCIGAGLGVLLAPKTGEESRSLIANKARDSADYLKQQAAGLRDSASDAIEKGRAEVKRRREAVEQAVDAGKQAYQAKVG